VPGIPVFYATVFALFFFERQRYERPWVDGVVAKVLKYSFGCIKIHDRRTVRPETR
jgi:hypothetical protein